MPATSRSGARTGRKTPAAVPRSQDTARLRPLPVLLRYISCGVLSLAAGLTWRLTLAPAHVAVGSAFAGIFFLLLGFMVGGVAWYAHDARVRTRAPERVPDERLVFSFVVFVVVPLLVLAVIGIVWLIAFVVGAT